MWTEKAYSDDPQHLSVGIANIHPRDGRLDENRQRIRFVLAKCAEYEVNLAVFPEYCLSGFLRDKPQNSLTNDRLDQCTEWLDELVRTYIDDTLQYIILNGLLKNGSGKEEYFNTSIVLDRTGNHFSPERSYKKTFLFGLEKTCLSSGVNDTLVLATEWGRLGFLTCNDICFPQVAHNLVQNQKVDAIIVQAAWRKQGRRFYPGLNLREKAYNQFLWNLILPALACQNQVWVIAANAVGPHSLQGLDYCGCSGIWAPSGLNLLQASDTREEFLILHNLDLSSDRDAEYRSE